MPTRPIFGKATIARPRLPARLAIAKRVATAFVAIGHLGAGAFLLWRQSSPVPGEFAPFRGTCGVLMFALGVWFGRQALSDTTQTPPAPARRLSFVGAWMTGVVVCYVGSLAVGASHSASYLFLTSIALWNATLFAFGEKWRAALATRFRLRAMIRGLCVLILAAPFAEFGLRLFAFCTGERVAAHYAAERLKLPAGSVVGGRAINRAGYWDDEFRCEPPTGAYRVAVVGDGVTICGDRRTNCLDRIETSIAGIEVYNFGLPSAGPREYVGQLENDVVRYRPDLVIIFFSLASDLTEQNVAPGWFDWRSLHLAQRRLIPGLDRIDRQPAGSNKQLSPSDAPGCEHLPPRCTAPLCVCQARQDLKMSRRWATALVHLDNLFAECEARGIPAALVIVPCEFQVDSQLLRALCRRAGCSRGSIDHDLPQRRLAAFARDRQIPVLDLLPHLRASDQPTYRRNSAVFNDHGNLVVSQVLGRWLVGRFGPMILAAEER